MFACSSEKTKKAVVSKCQSSLRSGVGNLNRKALVCMQDFAATP